MADVKKRATREGMGEEIVLLGEENRNVVVIDADLGSSCKTDAFKKALPDQYYNLGIAEQNCAGVAAGMATCGKIPVVVTYAAFGSMRMCEMVRQEICYPKLNVKLICSHGGLTPDGDGASHQTVEDLAIMRSIPNMTVIVPADYVAAKKLVRKAVEMDGPVYMRFTRNAVPILYEEEDNDFEIGRAKKLADGTDVSIISIGDTVRLALEAKGILAAKGISAEVLDMHTIKPMDEEAVRESIRKTGKLITIEDHSVINGLGSAVADIMAQEGKGILRKIGVQDTFGETAPYDRLMEKHGITTEALVQCAEELVK